MRELELRNLRAKYEGYKENFDVNTEAEWRVDIALLLIEACERLNEIAER